MFGTIRKHQTWLWALVITVMIVGLVTFFSPSAMRSGMGGSYRYGTIDGERISEEDYANAFHETQLHFFLNYGSWPDVEAKRLGYDSERETYSRLFFID